MGCNWIGRANCAHAASSKTSPFAPLAVTKTMEIISKEFPPGVLNIVHGEAEVGVELTSHRRWPKLHLQAVRIRQNTL
nr:aldehyde dehydrogenase family protein [Alicyclobacillus suci]